MKLFDIFGKSGENSKEIKNFKIGKNADERKINSIEKLKSEKIDYIDWLPLRYETDEIIPRTIEEISSRAICTLVSIQAAFLINNDDYTEEKQKSIKELLYKRYGQKEENLTFKEFGILNNEADKQDAVNMIWKYEAYWSLLWALGMVDELEFPSKVVDGYKANDYVLNCKDFEEFEAKVQLRSTDEILAQLDLHYRYHWACVNNRINGSTKKGMLDEEIVMERRAGLEWLCSKNKDEEKITDEYNNWDYPDLNT